MKLSPEAEEQVNILFAKYLRDPDKAKSVIREAFICGYFWERHVLEPPNVQYLRYTEPKVVK